MNAPTLPPQEVTGVVLAGGLGRRMSADGCGIDKGLCRFAGRPMVAHVIERLAPQVGALLLNTNGDLDAWRCFGLPIVGDRLAGHAGPLAGLHAALLGAHTPWVVTAPCDSPFLPTDLVARLGAAALAHRAPIAVARTGDQPHPVFALVSRALVADLERFLASGRRRIDAWTDPAGAVHVTFPDERAFRNVNTPDELERWSAEAAAPAPR
jgi:molybdopterin-guanine dinucleotide biosynthesis protein A